MKTYAMTPKLRTITFSRKEACFVHVCEDDASHNTASYWDGGSRDSYMVRNMTTGMTRNTPCGTYPQFHAETVLGPGEVLVRTGTFCGKPATPGLTVRRSDVALFEAWSGLKLEDKTCAQ